MNKPKTLLLPTTIYPRPEEAPEGWEVWNAPRPLLGSAKPYSLQGDNAQWQGDFLHGRFYVAVNPADDCADIWRKRNAALDGWVLEYITISEARERVFQHCLTKYGASGRWPEARIREMVEKASDKDLTQTLWNLLELEVRPCAV